MEHANAARHTRENVNPSGLPETGRGIGNEASILHEAALSFQTPPPAAFRAPARAGRGPAVRAGARRPGRAARLSRCASGSLMHPPLVVPTPPPPPGGHRLVLRVREPACSICSFICISVRSRAQVKSCGICLSPFGFFHLARCPRGPSVLSRKARFHSFSRPHNIPPCIHTTSSDPAVRRWARRPLLCRGHCKSCRSESEHFISDSCFYFWDCWVVW